jgi:uncharacterized protein (DUF4415 family)
MSDFNKTRILSKDFREKKKTRKYQVSLKLDTVVPELFHEEGQTGWQRHMTKLIDAFRYW